MAKLVKQFASGIYNLILGLFTTSKHLGRHAITIQYPKERWTMPERSRGMVVLLTDHETGKLNCNACLLCMRACPSGAIEIEFTKDEKKKRHLKEFTVDYNMCCLCGLCESTCNFAALKMAPKYEFPEFDRANLIYDSKKLAAAGFDVPYEKPVRKKKPVVKKAVDKPAEAKTDDKTSEEKPAEQPPAESKTPEVKPVEEKSSEAAEEKPAQDKPTDKAADKKDDTAESGKSDSESKEDKPL
jgi:NADH-quinone oxidoreductase subunit I